MSLARARVPVILASMLAATALAASAALAGAARGSVAGTVTDSSGAPVAGAVVTLDGAGDRRSRSTGPRGDFAIEDLAPGIYVLGATATGFDSVSGRTIEVSAGAITGVSIELSRSSSSLSTIGHVFTSGSEALSTSSAPTAEVNAQAYASRGIGNVIDLLEGSAPPSTIIRPAGGNPAAPAAIALRGPDPTETLFDVDGHALNSGGSGSFDASLLDPAQLQSVQLVYGVAPASLVGPNTIGGAVNVRTLDPTTQPHGLYRLSMGSYDAFGETLAATGTGGNTGYAVSLHRQTERGETDQTIAVDAGGSPSVGSAINAGSALAKVRVSLARGGSLQFSVRDQSAFRDLSASLSSILPGDPQLFNDFSGSASLTHNAGYGLDVTLPLGRPDAAAEAPATLTFRHLTNAADQSVVGPAEGTNPFLNDERDTIGDDIVELDRTLADQTFSLKLDLRSEALRTTITPGGVQDQAVVRGDAAGAGAGSVELRQAQRSLALRYTLDTRADLHYALALYASDFSTFGSRLDPRLSVVWTPTARTSLRGSIGSTFQTPQLPELYVPPVLPPPDADGFFHIGNPGLGADRATDYDVGAEHLIAGERPTHLTLDWYRSDVRNTSTPFVPALDCAPSVGPPPPPQACETFPVNIGGATYQGIEFALDRQLDASARLRASYDVNSCFPIDIPAAFSSGTIVDGEQFLGVPLHAASITLAVSPAPAFDYEAGLRYEGAYNELNRPPFATLEAGATAHVGRIDIGLYGTNLTGVYDDRFTLVSQGVPYRGISGPIATDAFSLQGPALTLVITSHY